MISTNPFVLLTNGIASVQRHWMRVFQNEKILNAVGTIIDGAMASEVSYAEANLTNWCDCDIAIWKADMDMFISMGDKAMGYRARLFRRVVSPMMTAYRILRESTDLLTNAKKALPIIKGMSDCVWKSAADRYITTIIRQLELPKNEQHHSIQPADSGPGESGQQCPVTG